MDYDVGDAAMNKESEMAGAAESIPRVQQGVGSGFRSGLQKGPGEETGL